VPQEDVFSATAERMSEAAASPHAPPRRKRAAIASAPAIFGKLAKALELVCGVQVLAGPVLKADLGRSFSVPMAHWIPLSAP